MDFLDLIFKEILLVEEKHDGGQCKESVVADTVEEMEGLVHAVLKRSETNRLSLLADLSVGSCFTTWWWSLNSPLHRPRPAPCRMQ